MARMLQDDECGRSELIIAYLQHALHALLDDYLQDQSSSGKKAQQKQALLDGLMTLDQAICDQEDPIELIYLADQLVQQLKIGTRAMSYTMRRTRKSKEAKEILYTTCQLLKRAGTTCQPLEAVGERKGEEAVLSPSHQQAFIYYLHGADKHPIQANWQEIAEASRHGNGHPPTVNFC